MLKVICGKGFGVFFTADLQGLAQILDEELGKESKLKTDVA